ncbi:RNA polymerase-associated protein rtf1 [Coemansia erecta]|uniref:RNA polymerase-associated protein rtf1 n=1 Tax=Coemansia erecta TaxID=147472 RepID=A0A9W7XZ94_9FUNG|nr:RNA polymerase-associated protein rtf1 [Coemansia erecta]
MDNLENDILELFDDEAGGGGGGGSEQTRAAAGSEQPRQTRQRRAPRAGGRRSEYSGSSSDVDMDTDASSAGEASADEWGADLMGDQRDRRHLASLPEIERERILAERQEIRDVQNEQRELRNKLRAGVRVSDRRRTAAAADDSRTFGGLKRARLAQRDASRSRSRSPARRGEAAGLAAVNTVCLARNQLEQWVFRPFFAQAVRGAVVRIVTRTRDSSGEHNQYRMMQVVGVATGQPYHINKTLTDRHLRLRFGASERAYSMETISNSPLRAEELAAWEAACQADGARGLTEADVRHKAEGLDQARAYKLSEHEITRMVDERNRLRQLGSGPRVADVALERAKLNQEKAAARQAGDWAALKAADQRLEELGRDSAAHSQAVAATHKPLLAPSKAKLGSFDSARRRPLHPQQPHQHQPAASPAAVAAMELLGQFRLVQPRRVPEPALRAKVTPGYAEIMAANGGFDMSFIAE